MLNTTDAILSRVNDETNQIVIDSDETLGPGDIQLIAQTIGRCPQLDKLAIRNCGLTSDMMDPLTRAIARHPFLSQLDFSGNKFESFDFAMPFVGYCDVSTGGGFYDR